MIIEAIVNAIVALLKGIMATFPDSLTLKPDVVNIPVAETMTWLVGIFASVAYVLPVTDILHMILVNFVVHNFAILWKLLFRIWDALPFT